MPDEMKKDAVDYTKVRLSDNQLKNLLNEAVNISEPMTIPISKEDLWILKKGIITTLLWSCLSRYKLTQLLNALSIIKERGSDPAPFIKHLIIGISHTEAARQLVKEYTEKGVMFS